MMMQPSIGDGAAAATSCLLRCPQCQHMMSLFASSVSLCADGAGDAARGGGSSIPQRDGRNPRSPIMEEGRKGSRVMTTRGVEGSIIIKSQRRVQLPPTSPTEAPDGTADGTMMFPPSSSSISSFHYSYPVAATGNRTFSQQPGSPSAGNPHRSSDHVPRRTSVVSFSKLTAQQNIRLPTGQTVRLISTPHPRMQPSFATAPDDTSVSSSDGHSEVLFELPQRALRDGSSGNTTTSKSPHSHSIHSQGPAAADKHVLQQPPPAKNSGASPLATLMRVPTPPNNVLARSGTMAMMTASPTAVPGVAVVTQEESLSTSGDFRHPETCQQVIPTPVLTPVAAVAAPPHQPVAGGPNRETMMDTATTTAERGGKGGGGGGSGIDFDEQRKLSYESTGKRGRMYPSLLQRLRRVSVLPPAGTAVDSSTGVADPSSVMSRNFNLSETAISDALQELHHAKPCNPLWPPSQMSFPTSGEGLGGYNNNPAPVRRSIAASLRGAAFGGTHRPSDALSGRGGLLVTRSHVDARSVRNDDSADGEDDENDDEDESGSVEMSPDVVAEDGASGDPDRRFSLAPMTSPVRNAQLRRTTTSHFSSWGPAASCLKACKKRWIAFGRLAAWDDATLFVQSLDVFFVLSSVFLACFSLFLLSAASRPYLINPTTAAFTITAQLCTLLWMMVRFVVRNRDSNTSFVVNDTIGHTARQYLRSLACWCDAVVALPVEWMMVPLVTERDVSWWRAVGGLSPATVTVSGPPPAESVTGWYNQKANWETAAAVFSFLMLRHFVRFWRLASLSSGSNPIVSERSIFRFLLAVSVALVVVCICAVAFQEWEGPTLAPILAATAAKLSGGLNGNVNVSASHQSATVADTSLAAVTTASLFASFDALYWSMTTALTVGYGDITPTTPGGRAIAMITMIVGTALLSVMTAIATSYFANKDPVQQELEQRKRKMTSMLEYFEVPWDLQRDVIASFPAVMEAHSRAAFLDMIEHLPEICRKRVEGYSRLRLLRRIHLFEGIEREHAFMLAKCLTQRFVAAQDFVVRQGELGNEMYFVVQGMLDVLVQLTDDGDEHIVVATIREGSFFGERGLLEDTPRAATVISITLTELLVLTRADFQEIVAAVPEIMDVFRRNVFKVNEEAAKSITADLCELPWLAQAMQQPVIVVAPSGPTAESPTASIGADDVAASIQIVVAAADDQAVPVALPTAPEQHHIDGIAVVEDDGPNMATGFYSM